MFLISVLFLSLFFSSFLPSFSLSFSSLSFCFQSLHLLFMASSSLEDVLLNSSPDLSPSHCLLDIPTSVSHRHFGFVQDRLYNSPSKLTYPSRLPKKYSSQLYTFASSLFLPLFLLNLIMPIPSAHRLKS